MRKIIFILITGVFAFSCSDDEGDIPSVEERTSAAINDLKDELTAPANGWRLEYSPTSRSGIFFMLLDFNDDGTVTIKSDVVDNDGEFVEETIPYRIDAALSLELIFETYGVFHYLFELDQAQFGAEFEFLYVEKDGDELVFKSKTDLTDITTIRLQPAQTGDESLFSLEEMSNLNQFDGVTPQIFGGEPPIQQVVLEDRNLSVFWSIDLVRRVIDVDFVGTGKTLAEINANTDNQTLNHITGYTILNNKLILLAPLTFSHNGQDITIDAITLTDFSITGSSLCSLNSESTPVYEGQITGVGSVTILKSLIDSSGFGFQPMGDHPYSVNVLFVFDGNANSLFETGIINEKFPNATGFIFNYGLDSDTQPANAVGFYVEDEVGNVQAYLREFEATSTVGNKVKITLTNNFYYSSTPGPSVEQDLTEITDIIFEGGDIYTYDLPQNGATVYRLFNPCNLYEAFLVQ